MPMKGEQDLTLELLLGEDDLGADWVVPADVDLASFESSLDVDAIWSAGPKDPNLVAVPAANNFTNHNSNQAEFTRNRTTQVQKRPLPSLSLSIVPETGLGALEEDEEEEAGLFETQQRLHVPQQHQHASAPFIFPESQFTPLHGKNNQGVNDMVIETKASEEFIKPVHHLQEEPASFLASTKAPHETLANPSSPPRAYFHSTNNAALYHTQAYSQHQLSKESTFSQHPAPIAAHENQPKFANGESTAEFQQLNANRSFAPHNGTMCPPMSPINSQLIGPPVQQQHNANFSPGIVCPPRPMSPHGTPPGTVYPRGSRRTSGHGYSPYGLTSPLHVRTGPTGDDVASVTTECQSPSSVMSLATNGVAPGGLRCAPSPGFHEQSATFHSGIHMWSHGANNATAQQWNRHPQTLSRSTSWGSLSTVLPVRRYRQQANGSSGATRRGSLGMRHQVSGNVTSVPRLISYPRGCEIDLNPRDFRALMRAMGAELQSDASGSHHQVKMLPRAGLPPKLIESSISVIRDKRTYMMAIDVASKHRRGFDIFNEMDIPQHGPAMWCDQGNAHCVLDAAKPLRAASASGKQVNPRTIQVAHALANRVSKLQDSEIPVIKAFYYSLCARVEPRRPRSESDSGALSSSAVKLEPSVNDSATSKKKRRRSSACDFISLGLHKHIYVLCDQSVENRHKVLDGCHVWLVRYFVKGELHSSLRPYVHMDPSETTQLTWAQQQGSNFRLHRRPYSS
mmetsp:Transcript_9369/g.18513  ORF Transcript_9369/g.18513 Transcript_9369/m.18513 type:complete len:738 (-) Transcript_9369:236-2449(-)